MSRCGVYRCSLSCYNKKMLHEPYIASKPSHFHINPIVKAFIAAETLLWSSWNLVIPIFAIFAATQIEGGSIEVAASTYSTYLIVRVLAELGSGKILLNGTDHRLFIYTIAGALCISIGYFGFSITTTVWPLYFLYGVIGFGLGISTPAKNTLFSTHLDKKKESLEWGITDAITFSGMAITAAIGGVIAQNFGFEILFIFAGSLNLISVIPYFFYMYYESHLKHAR